MGASAGLLPCPSALVVLLGAIAQHQIALGLLMIVVFSLGLACTLTGARDRGRVRGQADGAAEHLEPGHAPRCRRCRRS